MDPEEIIVPEEQRPEHKGCILCGHPVVLEGYPNRLCESCREKLIRFPVPKWIWIFGAGVLLVLAFSMSRLPANLSTALHMARGKKAEAQHRFITAFREFSAVNQRFPGMTEAKTHLAIAAYYNSDVADFMKMADQLNNVNIEDADQLNELNRMVTRMSMFLPRDSFETYFSRYQNLNDIPDSAFVNFHRLYPDDHYAMFQHINHLYDQNQDAMADSLLNGLMYQMQDFPVYLALKSGLKRQLLQFDSSYYFLEQLGAQNRENSFVYASMARTSLKQKQDERAWDEVMKAKALDPEDGYVLATLALAHHFRNETAERDKLIATAVKDSTKAEYMQYIRDIVSGKVKFRD